MEPISNKICSSCKKNKPIQDFYKRSGVGQKETKCCFSCRELATANYYAKHEEKKAYGRNYREQNKQMFADYQKAWKAANKEAFQKSQNDRYHNDPKYRAVVLEQTRPRLLVRSKGNAKRAMKAMGCTKEEFMAHIEAQFREGMTWENMGKAWEFDHIYPLSVAYDKGPEAFRLACHYSNIRPITEAENLSKGFKIPEDHPIYSLKPVNGLSE